MTIDRMAGGAAAPPVSRSYGASFTILWLAHNGNVIGRQDIDAIVSLPADTDARRIKHALQCRAVWNATRRLTKRLADPSDVDMNITAGFRVEARAKDAG